MLRCLFPLEMSLFHFSRIMVVVVVVVVFDWEGMAMDDAVVAMAWRSGSGGAVLLHLCLKQGSRNPQTASPSSPLLLPPTTTREARDAVLAPYGMLQQQLLGTAKLLIWHTEYIYAVLYENGMAGERAHECHACVQCKPTLSVTNQKLYILIRLVQPKGSMK